MKKIKWLTPLMGLTALSGCIVPLTTSCSATDKVLPTDMMKIVGHTLYGFKDGVDFSKYNTISIPSTVKIVGENSLNNIGKTITKIVFSKENKTFQQNLFKNNTTVTTLDFSSWTIEEVYYSKFDSAAFLGLGKRGKVVFNKNLKEETKAAFINKLFAAGLNPNWLVEETTGNISCEQRSISTKTTTNTFDLKLSQNLLPTNVLRAAVTVTSGSEGVGATLGSLTRTGTSVSMPITLTGLSKTNDNVEFDVTFSCYESESSKLPKWVQTLDAFKIVFTGEPYSTVTVTFKPNNGSADFTQEVIKGGKVTRPEDPEAPGVGASFGGWYSDPECKKSFDFNNTTVSQNITLYAGYYAQVPGLEGIVNPITGEATIIKAAESYAEEVLNIPAYISGCPVTAIDENAFGNNYTIKEVILPATLKVVGDSAFSGCESIKRINSDTDGTTILPDSITSIGNNSFSNNWKINKIYLPRNLVEIGANAFNGVNITNYKDETLPDGTTTVHYLPCNSIGTNSEEDEYFLANAITSTAGQGEEPTYISIHDNCKILGYIDTSEDIFDNLQTLSLPSSLISLQTKFSGAENFKTIETRGESNNEVNAFTFGKNLKCLPTYASAPFSSTCPTKLNLSACTELVKIADSCFENATGGYNEVILPPNLKSIGSCAFKGCNFTTITIPKTVEDIGGSAFPDCVTTYNIEAGNDKVKESNGNIYIINGDEVTLACVKNAETITSFDFSIIPGITTIGRNLFKTDGYPGPALQSITIPSTVKTIEENAFFYCTSLSSVTYSGTSQLEYIGDSAFKGCQSLNTSTFKFPAGLKYIGSFAFMSANNYYSSTPFEDTTGTWTITEYNPNNTEIYTVINETFIPDDNNISYIRDYLDGDTMSGDYCYIWTKNA